MPWFESRKNKERKSRFRQLVDMALADGELDPAEQDLLEAVAEGLEISPEDFQKILNHPERVAFTPPQNLDERLLQFAEIVDMMRADEQVKAEEQALAFKVAGRLGIPPSKTPQLIELISQGIEEHTEWPTVLSQLKTALKTQQ